MTDPKYKPIIFTAPMVRAILEGRKTQTRRLNGLDDVNKIPDAWDAARVTVGALNYKVKKSAKGKYGATFISHPDAIANRTIHVCPQICPYGQPGDRLWVREAFEFNHGGPVYDAAGGLMDSMDDEIVYRADRPNRVTKWTPSIHMPRWASRITLEITSVRVERVQDIRIKDCVAEGIRELVVDIDGTDAYKDLWQSLYGHDSWDKNPWVWVVEFKRV